MGLVGYADYYDSSLLYTDHFSRIQFCVNTVNPDSNPENSRVNHTCVVWSDLNSGKACEKIGDWIRRNYV